MKYKVYIKHFKVTFENKFSTLLKLIETNTLTYHFDKIFLAYGAQGMERSGTKKLLFFNFLFQEKMIVENININQ